jgi:hypothetical protein
MDGLPFKILSGEIAHIDYMSNQLFPCGAAFLASWIVSIWKPMETKILSFRVHIRSLNAEYHFYMSLMLF